MATFTSGPIAGCAWGLGLAVLACAVPAMAQARAGTALVTPAAAIASAVHRVLGTAVSVQVDDLRTAVAPASRLVARPQVNARLGVPARFTLSVGSRRVGTAVARVRVRARYVAAVAAIGRGEVIAPASVTDAEGDLAGRLIRPLPDRAALDGLEARRAIAPGDPVTADVVDVPPLVRSGDAVTAAIRIGIVEATGPAIASGSGNEGDVIRILRHGRRPLRARITGPGAVEVMP